MSSDHDRHCGPCDPCRPRCKKKKRKPKPSPCPDLATLCPAQGKFFEALNVFGDSVASGSPHVVVVDCTGCLTDDQLAAITAEFGRETVFIIGDPTSGGPFVVRAFNPSELNFSGTSALVAATFIRERFLCGQGDTVNLNFVAGGGIVPVTFDADNDPSFTTPPATFGAIIEGTDLDDLLACFGLTTGDLIDPVAFPVQEVSTGLPTVLIPVNSLAAVQNIVPDDQCQEDFVDAFNLAHPATPILGIFEVFSVVPEVVSAEANAHARVFGGALGLTEDPISAAPNSALAAYAVQTGLFGPAPISIAVEQGAEVGRPGLVAVSAEIAEGGIVTTVSGVVFSAATGRFNVNCA